MTDSLRPFRATRALIAASAFALVLATAGCGSSTSDAASPDATAEADGSTASPAGDDTTTVADDGSGDEGEAEAEGNDDAACVADSNELSGSSTVVWDDGDVAPELTMTFGDDGTLSPETLTVPVGERFAIASPAGSDLRAVKVGCAGAQTMPGGITAGFVIDAAGTYAIVDEAANDYAGAEVGTVVVE